MQLNEDELEQLTEQIRKMQKNMAKKRENSPKFKSLKIKTGNFKFNREEANERKARAEKNHPEQDMISRLIQKPLKKPGFVPMNRDEIYGK
ncbi:MAG: hypothetical protein PHW04_02790 [Candidatus Wallbacteria bacterium]|nr:hypothetical protein [Candidatus Wallbacteria bacterium]